jgi:signal transduction histidine kinase
VVAPKISITLQRGGDKPPCCTEGDPALLRQVFLHLISNACESIEAEGTITIELQCTSNEGFDVVIKDTGCGIAQEDLSHIFDPFFSRKPAGTGLGLCATKKILDLHGAEIIIESHVGQGTTARVRLRALKLQEGEHETNSPRG